MRWLSLLLVLMAGPVWSDVAKLVVIPDSQNITSCTNATSAWTTGLSAYQYVAALTDVDYVIQTGDIVEELAFGGGFDCFCMGSAEPPGGCGDLVHPYDGAASCADCADAEAINCVGGTAGVFCEWTRAKVLRDLIHAQGIPQLYVLGNHDLDRVLGSSYGNAFTAFQTHFPPQTDFVDLVGQLSVSNMTPVISEPAVFHVFTAAGMQWLSFGIPISPWWRPTRTGAAEDRAEIIAWVLEIIDRFPGMPTMISAHLMLTSANGEGTHPFDKDCGLCEDEDFDTAGNVVGRDMFNLVASVRPQVFLLNGGHDRDTRHIVSTTDNGDRVVGNLVDWSFGFDDSLSDVPDGSYLDSDIAVGVGGGGVVQILSIDPKHGRMWAWAKAAHSDATDGTTATDGRDMRYGDPGTTWTVQMPLCADNRRFNIPAAACD